MTFLQLVQRLHTLARVGQGELATNPATVEGQTGLLGELVAFIQMAWQDIQSAHPQWQFMVKEGTLTLPQGVNEVSPLAIDDYDRLIFAASDGRGRFITFYRDSRADEQTCRFVPYQDYRYSYLDRGERQEGIPGNFTVLPNRRFRFDMLAEEALTLRFDYKRTIQTLALDGDEPIMPAKYHMAIVWWAIARYYSTTRDGTGELRAKAKIEMDREMQQLFNQQIPELLGYEVAP